MNITDAWSATNLAGVVVINVNSNDFGGGGLSSDITNRLDVSTSMRGLAFKDETASSYVGQITMSGDKWTYSKGWRESTPYPRFMYFYMGAMANGGLSKPVGLTGYVYVKHKSASGDGKLITPSSSHITLGSQGCTAFNWLLLPPDYVYRWEIGLWDPAKQKRSFRANCSVYSQALDASAFTTKLTWVPDTEEAEEEAP